MTYEDLFTQVREEHTRLCDLVEKGNDVLRPSPSGGGFDNAEASNDGVRLSEIESLVARLKHLASMAGALEDYRWISEALLRWQVTVTNILDEPIDTDIPMPHFLSAPSCLATQSLTGEEINHFLRVLAEARAAHRKILIGRLSTASEMNDDSETAKTFFALDVIRGRINFASRIGQESYPLLEQTWLKEVKNVLAYLMWLDRVDRYEGGPLDDYFLAVSHIRDLLIDPGIKARPEEFATAHSYLEEHYLSSGVLDPVNNDNARGLVRAKAKRIYDVTGNRSEIENWIEAETYSALFYDNIIPASVKGDKEATLNVLKAFQFSKAPEHNYYIITAFETALAIYFLDWHVVKQLWDESATKPRPERVISSAVKVDSWPDRFEVPESCSTRFFYTGSEILFRGVMSESQRDTLARGLGQLELDALRELFDRSRLIHQETTL